MNPPTTMSEYAHILLDKRDGVAHVILNRPEKRNALGFGPGSSRDEIVRALADADADATIGAIVLEANGPTFCAGGDLSGLPPGEGPVQDETLITMVDTFHAAIRQVTKPVIAMLNGATAGIGLVHALYCDLRFAADNTVFTTAFARRGLIAEHGISWMLPHIVGHAHALDLLLSARRVPSEEALRIGLVNRLYPADQLREQTYAYARDLADFVSPSAMSVIKRQVYDVPFQTLAEATIDANREMIVALQGEDFREGVASFVEKRPPRFKGR